MALPDMLFHLPPAWQALPRERFAGCGYRAVFPGDPGLDPASIRYCAGFRPPLGALAGLPALRAVLGLGAGVDGFLRDPDFPKHVPLYRFRNPDLAEQMAHYVVMHALGIYRQSRQFATAQSERSWRQVSPAAAIGEFRVGILGFGDIGHVVARHLTDIGFDVLGWSRLPKAHSQVRTFSGGAELTPFLSSCDVVVCLLPLTPETEGLLDRRTLAALPTGAWLINVARGGLIDENALLACLDDGHFGGAVLDVFRIEPLPESHAFWAHPKVIVTPHIAAVTRPEAAVAHLESCVGRLEQGLDIGPAVDVAQGY